MIARIAAHLTKALSRYVSMTEDEAEVVSVKYTRTYPTHPVPLTI